MAKKPASPKRSLGGSTKTKDYVVAKTEDGTLQITYTITANTIEKSRNAVVDEYLKTTTIPGFRKGKAPRQKILEKIPQTTLIEKTLRQILPTLLGKTITEEKLKLAIYPKFELVSAKEGEAWQVRAFTCEIPSVELGDYKKIVAGEIRAKSLKKELTHPEKERVALQTLIETVKIKTPKILIEEEVNNRLSQLLARIEKLGLSLEKYLASIGKSVENLRGDYEKQAKEAITLDLALLQIAQQENITIGEKQIEAAIAASQADPTLAKNLNNPSQRNALKALLLKRSAVEKLIHL